MTKVEEYPGSVGVTPAYDEAAGGDDSELNLSGGQRLWLALGTLTSVLAVIAAIVVMIRIGADENRGGNVAVVSGPATEWVVDATEFAFEPVDVVVPVGEEVTVEMINAGSVEHEWVLLEGGARITDEAEYSEDMVLARTALVGGGETTSVAFTVDSAGTYQVICTVAGHFSAGMAGTLRAES